MASSPTPPARKKVISFLDPSFFNAENILLISKGVNVEVIDRLMVEIRAVGVDNILLSDPMPERQDAPLPLANHVSLQPIKHLTQ